MDFSRVCTVVPLQLRAGDRRTVFQSYLDLGIWIFVCLAKRVKFVLETATKQTSRLAVTMHGLHFYHLTTGFISVTSGERQLEGVNF